MYTGTTFGDCTSPGNWEVIAKARQQLAQYLWRQPDSVERTKKYLPVLHFVPSPTPHEVSQFVQAIMDSINKGVLDAHGNRIPPGYDHHVDDNHYSDVRSHMLCTISKDFSPQLTSPACPSPQSIPSLILCLVLSFQMKWCKHLTVILCA